MLNSILKYYHLTFARCYYWSLKVNKYSKSHVFYASVMLLMGVTLNITTVVLLLHILGVLSPSNVSGADYLRYLIAGIAMIVLEFNFRYFKRNDNYKKIIQMFPHTGSHTFVFFYSVGSFALLVASTYIGFYLV